MTVSELIFDYLAGLGCKLAYMVSGSSAMWLTDALQRNKQIKAVCCHHEQAAAMSADAYGRMEGIPGICLVTIGPGATNAITGVAGAYVDSSPMIVLSGQANSRLLQYETDTGIRQHGTQSLPLKEIVSPITKYFAAVMDPADIRYHLERACYECVSGRPGPVWLDIPVNVQNMQVPQTAKGFQRPEEASPPDMELIKQAAELLSSAKRPLILAGNGVRLSGAAGIFQRFADTYRIPVVTSRGGIDCIESENSLYVGRPGSYGDRPSHFAIQNCDVLLILGSRLSVSTVGYYPDRFAGKAKRIMVDIDQKELDKPDVPLTLRIHMDVKLFLELLERQLQKTSWEPAWLEGLTTLKKKYPVVEGRYFEETPLNAYAFTKMLTEQAPENAVVVVDTGSVCNIVSQTWDVKQGQRYLISGGLSCMGFWAAGIGAATLGKQTVVLTGDGSAQMNIQELATLAYHKLPVKLFVYQNHGYMLIRHNQHNYMDDRFLGVGPDSGVQTPDFCKIAQAYGIPAIRITSESDVKEEIRRVFEETGPILCEVILQDFQDIAPRIASRVMPDGSLKAAEFEDLYPFIDLAEAQKCFME